MTQYDVFISYARKDDVPDPDAGLGWVSGIKAEIEHSSRKETGREYEVFFDRDRIEKFDPWADTIRSALRSSRVMLVCVSENYFASPPCKWEWDEFAMRRSRMLSAGRGSGGVVCPVFFVLAPGTDLDDVREWRQSVQALDGFDVQEWFPYGASYLQHNEVKARLVQLAGSISDDVRRVRRAEEVRGNLMGRNSRFIGRQQRLEKLHSWVLSSATIGVVTAVHGLGGIGKTELVVQYAYQWSDLFPGGVWLLRAEGHDQVLALLATLAEEPAFGLGLSDAAKANSELAGREVWQELVRRTRASNGGEAVLLVFDNVDRAGLLAPSQVSQLEGETAIHMVATTRLGKEDFPASKAQVGFLELGQLPEAEALELIRVYQPKRGDEESGEPDFADAAEENAARRIVSALGGFTLAVEQVAIYLGAHPDVAVSRFADALDSSGAVAMETRISDDAKFSDMNQRYRVEAGKRNQDATLAAVLGLTMRGLPALAVLALRFAAILPPDTVPWPWLEQLCRRAHPDLFAVTDPYAAADPWPEVKRLLLGRRLLTDGDEPFARMHRLVGDHVRRTVESDKAAGFESDVVAVITEAVEAADLDGTAAVWQLRAVIDAALPQLPASNDLVNLGWSDFLQAAYSYVGAAVLPLAEALVTARRALYDGAPDNLTYQRDLAVGLDDWAWLVRNWDTSRADGYYREAVDLHRALYEGAPDNRTYQRDLAIGLGDWAWLVRNWDLARADGYYRQSVDLRRTLYEGASDNQTYQRDIAVGLGDWAGLVQDWDTARADGYYRQSVDLHRALYEGAPDNQTYQRDLAIGLKDWAWLVQDWDTARADGYYHQSVDLHRALYEGAPDNQTYQRDLAIGLVDWCLHRERSGLQVPTGDWVEACELWRGLAAVRKLQAAEERSRALACSRAWVEFPESVVDQSIDDSAAMMDESILAEVGLDTLPKEYRQALLRQVTSTLQKRVGRRIAAGLTDEQMAEFERFMDTGDQEGALAWLESNAPDYQTITRRVLDELKEELRINAPVILAAAGESEADPEASSGS